MTAADTQRSAVPPNARSREHGPAQTLPPNPRLQLPGVTFSAERRIRNDGA
jgi:hypothetical protein